MKNSSTNSQPPKWKSWAENIKLLTETFNNIMPLIKIAIGILGIALLTVFIQSQLNSDNDIDRYIADATRFQEEAQLAVAFADSLQQEIQIVEARANEASQRATYLSQQVRTLREDTQNLYNIVESTIQSSPENLSYNELLTYTEEIIPLQQQIIEQQERTINLQELQINELEEVIIWKDEAIQLLTQSNDSLQFVLKNPPVIPSSPNKMFGISLPSRTTSFIAGALTATVAIVVLTN